MMDELPVSDDYSETPSDEVEDSDVTEDTDQDFDNDSESDDEEDKPAPKAKRKYKYKADDEEVEEELDDDELAARLSHAKAAHRRMAAAAKAQKEIDLKEQRWNDVAKGFTQNPRTMFEHYGIKGEAYWNWIQTEMERYVEEQYLTPNERAALDHDRRQKELLEEQQKVKDAEDLQKVQNLIVDVSNEVESEIMDALNSLNVPKIPAVRDRILMDTIKEMILDHHRALEDDRKPTLTMEKAMKKAMRYRNDTFLGHLKGMTAEQMFEILGDDVATTISKEQARRIQAKRVPPSAPVTNSSPKIRREEASKKPVSTNDLRKKWR